MAAVTPVASVEALERAIQRSGLLSAEALTKVHEAASKASEPKQLARDLVKGGILTRWQAEQLLHGFHRLIVGKYKLLDQIGTSPTGRIYLVEHVQIGRRHALKVLAKRLASKPEAVKRFLSAAQTACGLDHRNVSHVYDVTQDHERQNHYVVMEYVEGESLERLVERFGGLEPELALNYIVQAADGLIHAHQNGVMHGDLKPSNLILDSTGTIKIIEIGQASAGAAFEAEGADESIEMAALAAVIFQSPELRGDGEVPTVACDVYSLGSVLTFLLTAKAAPDAAAAGERLREKGSIPPELIALCQRMMADNPSDRPPSIAEVADELVACAQKLAASTNQAAGVALIEQDPAPAKGKAKKPPVAKPLDDSEVAPIIISGATTPVVEPIVTEPIVIKAGGAVAKKPAIQQTTAHDDADAPAAETTPVVTAGSFSPLVLGAIGGGIFVVVALLVAVILLIFMANRGSEDGVAEKQTAAPVAQEAPSGGDDEGSNPVAPGEEQNPAVNLLPTVDEPAVVASATAPEPAEVDVTTAPTPSPVVEPPATTEVPETEKAAQKSQPTPAKTVAKSEAKPESKKTPTKPATKPVAKAPAKLEPFKGLAAAVTLPSLPDPGAANGAASPLVLGPCKIDETAPLDARLVGGDTAVRGTRHRFELSPTADSKNSWDVLIDGAGPPSKIATLAADGKSLLFQWTEEAGKQSAIAKQLCNCAVQLAIGGAQHTLALRTPVRGQPLVVDIDKPGGTTRWVIGDLPPAKQLLVEIIRAEGPKGILVEPKEPVAIGEDLNVWFGESAEVLPVLIKLDTSTNSRDLEIKQLPHIKLEGQEPRMYRKKEMEQIHLLTAQQLALLDKEWEVMRKSSPKRELEKQLRDQKLDLVGKQRLTAGAIVEQIRFTMNFAEEFKGTALVHIRVFYQAGDTKVELLRTADPTVAKSAK